MRVFYTASFKVKLHLAKQGNPPDNHPSQSSFLKINLVFKVKKVRLGADSGNVNTQVFRARFRYRQEFPMPAAQRQRKPMPVIPKVEERRGLPFFPNRNLYTFLYLFFFREMTSTQKFPLSHIHRLRTRKISEKERESGWGMHRRLHYLLKQAMICVNSRCVILSCSSALPQKLNFTSIDQGLWSSRLYCNFTLERKVSKFYSHRQ